MCSHSICNCLIGGAPSKTVRGLHRSHQPADVDRQRAGRADDAQPAGQADREARGTEPYGPGVQRRVARHHRKCVYHAKIGVTTYVKMSLKDDQCQKVTHANWTRGMERAATLPILLCILCPFLVLTPIVSFKVKYDVFNECSYSSYPYRLTWETMAAGSPPTKSCSSSSGPRRQSSSATASSIVLSSLSTPTSDYSHTDTKFRKGGKLALPAGKASYIGH